MCSFGCLLHASLNIFSHNLHIQIECFSKIFHALISIQFQEAPKFCFFFFFNGTLLVFSSHNSAEFDNYFLLPVAHILDHSNWDPVLWLPMTLHLLWNQMLLTFHSSSFPLICDRFISLFHPVLLTADQASKPFSRMSSDQTNISLPLLSKI